MTEKQKNHYRAKGISESIINSAEEYLASTGYDFFGLSGDIGGNEFRVMYTDENGKANSKILPIPTA